MTGQTGDEQQQRKGSADPHLGLQERSPHSLQAVAWGNRSFNINSSAQWEAGQRAVDELGPYLKWSTRAQLTSRLKARKKEANSYEAELTRLSADDPKILEKLVRGDRLHQHPGRGCPRSCPASLAYRPSRCGG
jgi:hypothetical protein